MEHTITQTFSDEQWYIQKSNLSHNTNFYERAKYAEFLAALRINDELERESTEKRF